jgi:hypothetical protein
VEHSGSEHCDNGDKNAPAMSRKPQSRPLDLQRGGTQEHLREISLALRAFFDRTLNPALLYLPSSSRTCLRARPACPIVAWASMVAIALTGLITFLRHH